MTRLLLVITFAALFAAFAKAETKPPDTVVSVDLNRYQGKWYEIARLPNRFQKQCVGNVAATYRLRADGKITVLNECKLKDGTTDRAEGIARLPDEGGPTSKLKVRFAPSFLSFLPFVWGDYWVLDLAPDYSHALIGDPARKYMWILARSPKISEQTYEQIVAKAKTQGFAVDQLIRTKQE